MHRGLYLWWFIEYRSLILPALVLLSTFDEALYLSRACSCVMLSWSHIESSCSARSEVVERLAPTLPLSSLLPHPSLPFSLTLQITMLKFILPSIFILGPPNKINMFQSSIQQPNSLNHSRRWKIYHCQNCQGTDKRSNLLGRLKTTKKLLSPVSHPNVQDHLNFFKIISPNFYLQKPDKCGAKVQ